MRSAPSLSSHFPEAPPLDTGAMGPKPSTKDIPDPNLDPGVSSVRPGGPSPLQQPVTHYLRCGARVSRRRGFENQQKEEPIAAEKLPLLFNIP